MSDSRSLDATMTTSYLSSKDDKDLEQLFPEHDGITLILGYLEYLFPKKPEKEQILLDKLKYKIPLHILDPDSLSESLLLKQNHCFEKKEEKLSEKTYISSYTTYLKTKHKIPKKANFVEYLSELNDEICSDQNEKWFLTCSEKKYIESRKIWTDVVSNVEIFNEKYIKNNNIKSNIINRLKKLGYTTDHENIYQKAIRFLKFNTAIVLSFNASFLKDGISDYQPVSMFERNTGKSSAYKAFREITEDKIYECLDDKLKKLFFSNIHARPKYAALMLLDRNHTVEAIIGYGKSYVVLDDIIKLNSLFFPCDSLNIKALHGKDLLPSTYHHLDILLLQCSDTLLDTIAKRVVYGILPSNYSPQMNLSGDHGYLEVHIPSINLLNRDLITHIHIDKSEYVMTSDEIFPFTSLNISLTNDTENPYPKLCGEFMQCVEHNKIFRFQELLKSYPLLARITNRIGEEPIAIATKRGHYNIVKLLIKYYSDLNILWPDGKALIHHAVESGSLLMVQALGEMKGINFNVRTSIQSSTTSDGMTPVFIASYLNQVDISILEYLIKKGADTSIATTNGQTPLIAAAYSNHLDRINAIIATGKININSVAKGGHTALSNAVENGNDKMVKAILAVKDIKIISNKKDDGESSLFIAASQGKVKIVELLLKVEGIDIEAKRDPGDGKTALQIAEQKKHIDIAKLFKTYFIKNVLYKTSNENKDTITISSDRSFASAFQAFFNKNHNKNSESSPQQCWYKLTEDKQINWINTFITKQINDFKSRRKDIFDDVEKYYLSSGWFFCTRDRKAKNLMDDCNKTETEEKLDQLIAKNQSIDKNDKLSSILSKYQPKNP